MNVDLSLVEVSACETALENRLKEWAGYENHAYPTAMKSALLKLKDVRLNGPKERCGTWNSI